MHARRYNLFITLATQMKMRAADEISFAIILSEKDGRIPMLRGMEFLEK
jgi:hypothetical protein